MQRDALTMVGLAVRFAPNGGICVRLPGLLEALAWRAALAVWAEATVIVTMSRGFVPARRCGVGELRWATTTEGRPARGRWSPWRGSGGVCAPS